MNLDEILEKKQTPSWYVPILKVQAGEIASIRFLGDYSDFKGAYFHQTSEFSSQLGRNVYRDVLCTSESDGQCEFCDQGYAPNYLRIHSWIWCYNILKNIPPTPEAEPVVRGNKTLYKVPVNTLRLFRTGPGRNKYIINSLKSYYMKYGTLEDRDFEWSRQGSGKEDTTYSLVPEDRAEFTVDTSSVEIPDLDEYIRKAYSKRDSAPANGSPQRLLESLEKSTNTSPKDLGELL